MKKRLFVAIDLSDDVRSQVSRHIDRLRNALPGAEVGWTRFRNLHLTLKFLGGVEEVVAPEVGAAMNAALMDFRRFDLEIIGSGVFPSARKAKVLWLGVRDCSGQLALAARKIEENLAPFGFPTEERQFSPHLTIGRSRRGGVPSELVNAHLVQTFESIAFNVDRIVLYESRLTPSGPLYSEVSCVVFRDHD